MCLGVFDWNFSVSLLQSPFIMKPADRGMLAGFTHASCPGPMQGSIKCVMLVKMAWSHLQTSEAILRF